MASPYPSNPGSFRCSISLRPTRTTTPDLHSHAAEEAAKIGYAVTRMEGKAADQFVSWMRAKRRAGEEVTIEAIHA